MRFSLWALSGLLALGLPMLALAQQSAPPANVERTPFVSLTQDDLEVMVANVQRPNGMSFLNGKLYTICNGDWTIYEIDAETAATVTFVNGARNAHQMYSEETESGFNIWIPDFDLNRLSVVTNQRNAPAVVATDDLDGPWGIAPLDEEHFLVSNLKANNIVKISRDGDVEAFLGELRSPAGLAIDDKTVYVANNGSARRAIEWFTVNEDGHADEVHPLVSGLQNVSNLVLGPDDYLYFTYALGSRGVVGRVWPEDCKEGGCTNDQVEIVVYTEMEAPLAGLTISPDMTMFLHTIYRPEIYKVGLGDGSTVSAETPSASPTPR
jgi:hypothetical protein